MLIPVRVYVNSRTPLLDQATGSNNIGPTTFALLWICRIQVQRTMVSSRCKFRNIPICFQIFLKSNKIDVVNLVRYYTK